MLKYFIPIFILLSNSAFSYDLLNDLLSFGLHRLWKRELLALLSPLPGETWLDLCCGTGDLAFSLARKVFPNGRVVGIDSAKEPLALARKRALKESRLPISFVKADALDTGLEMHSFDGVVMGYGLRNLADPQVGLKEIHRVLKPGASAGILDFNKLSDHSNRSNFQKFYLEKIVVPIAGKFGLREHYLYLEESLKHFPDGHNQECLAREVGFTVAKHEPIAAGLMGILLVRS